jgi:HAD superfamily hydrolase (TIGR01484 family)
MIEVLPVEKGPQADAMASSYVRLASYDVDGTLVRDNSDDHPSDAFLQTVREATSRGIAVCLNGARGYNKMVSTIHRPIAESAADPNLVRYGSYANGALIYDYSADAFIVKNSIPVDVTSEIASYLRGAGIFHWVHELYEEKESVDFAFIGRPGDAARRRGDYGTPKNPWLANSPNNEYEPVAYEPIEPLVIVADGMSESVYHTLTKMVETYREQGIKSVLYGFNETDKTYQVFILNDKANKGYALRTLAKLYGVSVADCAVVGDGGNDIDMFRESVAAGGLAFAMGNAAPELKLLATHVLPTQAEDGAAAGLRYILDNYSKAN